MGGEKFDQEKFDQERPIEERKKFDQGLEKIKSIDKKV